MAKQNLNGSTITPPPLRERVNAFAWLRRPIRNAFFSFLRKVSNTEDAREMAASTLAGLLDQSLGNVLADGPPAEAPPYPELGKAGPEKMTCHRSDIIVITGRFRSGSTLLWNLFRNMNGFTSYYEPLNERRWFDPKTRGDRIDATHRNVSDQYWREYEGLEELGNYYRESWIYRNLCMGADFWDPNLKRYVELMIEKSPGRPVLQFNRIDFRLPWFRHHFPNAKLIHLYRHPRDQWCSSLMDLKVFPHDARMENFAANDHFYLLNWARDLKFHFPFLAEQGTSHPYQLFYYIWKLSYLFGRKCAHHSVGFEHLVADPKAQLGELFRVLNLDGVDLDQLLPLFAKPSLGKWKEYADDAWFRKHEEACETVLADFLALPR